MNHTVPVSKVYVFGHVAHEALLSRNSAQDNLFTDYLCNCCPSCDYGTALFDWLQGWDVAEAEHDLSDGDP
jgi:hypothetical protein